MENWSNRNPPHPTSPHPTPIKQEFCLQWVFQTFCFFPFLVASAKSWNWERLLSLLAPWQMKVNISSTNPVTCVTQASTCWRKSKNVRNVTNAARSRNSPKHRHNAFQHKQGETPKNSTKINMDTTLIRDINFCGKFWILICRVI